MKERPILFSGPMVRAILDGRKTQTRRAVKPQPTKLAGPNFDGLWSDTIDPVVRYFACPYGQPGDRLWVKETFVPTTDGKNYVYRADARDRSGYRWTSITPDDKDVKWKPSIFCTRAASRIALKITDVRAERLQDISEADAISEGIDRDTTGVGWARYTPGWPTHGIVTGASARDSYASLWESINGKNSWAANPWVWVIVFKPDRLKGTQ